MTKDERPVSVQRGHVKETRWWIFVVLFVLTLPISFPLFLVYSKLSKWPIRGKGIAFLFFLWLAVTGVSGLLLAAYLHRGLEGLKTFLLLGVAVIIWAIVVFVALRILIEVIVLFHKFWVWYLKRSKK